MAEGDERYQLGVFFLPSSGGHARPFARGTRCTPSTGDRVLPVGGIRDAVRPRACILGPPRVIPVGRIGNPLLNGQCLGVGV